jgi:hypothetical protein
VASNPEAAPVDRMVITVAGGNYRRTAPRGIDHAPRHRKRAAIRPAPSQ